MSSVGGQCTGCGKDASKLYTCPCFAVKYCSTDCQKNDWSTHQVAHAAAVEKRAAASHTDNVPLRRRGAGPSAQPATAPRRERTHHQPQQRALPCGSWKCLVLVVVGLLAILGLVLVVYVCPARCPAHTALDAVNRSYHPPGHGASVRNSIAELSFGELSSREDLELLFSSGWALFLDASLEEFNTYISDYADDNTRRKDRGGNGNKATKGKKVATRGKNTRRPFKADSSVKVGLFDRAWGRDRTTLLPFRHNSDFHYNLQKGLLFGRSAWTHATFEGDTIVGRAFITDERKVFPSAEAAERYLLSAFEPNSDGLTEYASGADDGAKNQQVIAEELDRIPRVGKLFTILHEPSSNQTLFDGDDDDDDLLIPKEQDTSSPAGRIPPWWVAAFFIKGRVFVRVAVSVLGASAYRNSVVDMVSTFVRHAEKRVDLFESLIAQGRTGNLHDNGLLLSFIQDMYSFPVAVSDGD